MPAHARNAHSLERGLDLLFQHCGQIERLATLEPFRSEDEVPWLVVKTLRSPLQKPMFEPRVHRQRLSRTLRLCIDEAAAPTPVIGMLDVEGPVVEIAIHPADGAWFPCTSSQ